MSALSSLRDGYRRHLHEFEWMVATAAALVCCSIAIVTAIVAFAPGGLEHGGTEMTLRQYGDELSYDFETLGTPAAPRYKDGSDSSGAPRPFGAVPPETTPEAGIDTSCSGGGWPYFSDDCLWTTEAPRHRRPAPRARSFWCSGLLRHQPFCRSRPR
jgi:hypothetical protein